jgi:RHS repeat-associated protein
LVFDYGQQYSLLRGAAAEGDGHGPARLGHIGHEVFPYREESVTTAQDRFKFATYYRDSTTGLDYADQRFYASAIGRFITPDPYQSSGEAMIPGTWNRYSYVVGDPINFFDPRGLLACPASTSYSVTVCDAAPQVESWTAEYQQQLDYMRYYYSGQYYGASPNAPQPDTRTLESVGDRLRTAAFESELALALNTAMD